MKEINSFPITALFEKHSIELCRRIDSLWAYYAVNLKKFGSYALIVLFGCVCVFFFYIILTKYFSVTKSLFSWVLYTPLKIENGDQSSVRMYSDVVWSCGHTVSIQVQYFQETQGALACHLSSQSTAGHFHESAMTLTLAHLCLRTLVSM